jgi:hypothetical protein
MVTIWRTFWEWVWHDLQDGPSLTWRQFGDRFKNELGSFLKCSPNCQFMSNSFSKCSPNCLNSKLQQFGNARPSHSPNVLQTVFIWSYSKFVNSCSTHSQNVLKIVFIWNNSNLTIQGQLIFKMLSKCSNCLHSKLQQFGNSRPTHSQNVLQIVFIQNYSNLAIQGQLILEMIFKLSAFETTASLSIYVQLILEMFFKLSSFKTTAIWKF